MTVSLSSVSLVAVNTFVSSMHQQTNEQTHTHTWSVKKKTSTAVYMYMFVWFWVWCLCRVRHGLIDQSINRTGNSTRRLLPKEYSTGRSIGWSFRRRVRGPSVGQFVPTTLLSGGVLGGGNGGCFRSVGYEALFAHEFGAYLCSNTPSHIVSVALYPFSLSLSFFLSFSVEI